MLIWPGSSLLKSNLTGAPAALAFADGFQEPTNGTATPTTPAAPTTLVAAVRNFLLWS
jgi:hypothetical protein